MTEVQPFQAGPSHAFVEPVKGGSSATTTKDDRFLKHVMRVHAAPRHRFPVGSAPRDFIFFFLFVVNVAALFAVFFMSLSDLESLDLHLHASGRIFYFIVALVIGLFSTFVWLIILIRYPASIIRGTLWTMFILTTTFGVVTFVITNNNAAWGVFWLLCSLMVIVYYFMVRSRIPMATVVLRSAIQMLMRAQWLFLAAILNTVVQMLFLLLWVYTMEHARHYYSNNTAISIFLIVNLFWTSQAIKNVMQVVTCYTCSQVFFCVGQGNPLPDHVAGPALKRALWTSFGSVAIASLILGPLKIFRTTFEALRRTSTQNACCEHFGWTAIGGCEPFMKRCNNFGLAHVAIFGLPFFKASSQAWSLLAFSGCDIVLNDDVLTGALMLGSVLMGGLTGFITGIWAYSTGNINWFVDVAFPAGLVGLVGGLVMLDVVEAAMITSFSVFIQEPESVFSLLPDLGTKLYLRFGGITDEEQLSGINFGWGYNRPLDLEGNVIAAPEY